MIWCHNLIFPPFPLFPLYTPHCNLWALMLLYCTAGPFLLFAVLRPLHSGSDLGSLWYESEWRFFCACQLDLAALSYTPGSLGWTWLLVRWIWSSPKEPVLPGFRSALLSSADLTDQEMGGNGSKVEKSWAGNQLGSVLSTFSVLRFFIYFF